MFKVYKRNYGHWDISDDKRRLFRIRGTPGEFQVMDEREHQFHVTKGFKTVSGCMLFIADELMHEEIVADPMSPANNMPISKLHK